MREWKKEPLAVLTLELIKRERVDLIARLAPEYEECTREEAPLYNGYQQCLMFGSEGWFYTGYRLWQVPPYNALVIWLRKRKAAVPTPAIPAGFEACTWEAATPQFCTGHGSKLGLQSDGTLDFWWKGKDATWLRPAIPDAGKLGAAIFDDLTSNMSAPTSYPFTRERIAAAVRRALTTLGEKGGG